MMTVSRERLTIGSLALAAALLSTSSSGADDPRLDPRTKGPVVSAPDLIPWNLGWALCAPTVECRNCPPVSTLVGVKNQGPKAANGAIVVQLFGPTNQPLYTTTINTVPAGGTVQIGAFSHPRECPGDPQGPSLRYRIVVDAKNAVPESNEQNNSAVWLLKGNFSPK